MKANNMLNKGSLRLKVTLVSGLLLSLGLCFPAQGDDFNKEDLARWEREFQEAAKYGRSLFDNSAKFQIGTNKVACAQCHPNGANTHPETYPKYQKQLGKVSSMWEMVNWCIKNPLQGKALAADSKEMTALLAYIHSERKGVKLAPGKH